MTQVQNGHDKAREIAAQLSGRGLPVVGYHDLAGKIGISFQLQDDAAKYMVRCSKEEACADWFERMYRAVE
jgi:geranylgeranyl pyrophosphate synthase